MVCIIYRQLGCACTCDHTDSVHLILKNVSLHFLVQNLEGELDQLTEKCGNQADKIHQLGAFPTHSLQNHAAVNIISTHIILLGEESSVTELRAEVKRRLLEYKNLEEELGQLTDEYDDQVDINNQLKRGDCV